jgi:hypothetical protein
MDIEAAVRILEIDDENVNHDLEIEVLHSQGLPKHQPKLELWRKAYRIEHHPGDLWWKGDALVIVENDDLRRGVVSLFHDSITAGHPGIAKTTEQITKYYWWPGMRDFIIQYIKGCATCQMNKVNTHPTKPPIYPITPAANALPFQTIALDFITKLPESLGYDTILTITDHDCSKASIFIPCNETIDSEGVAKVYAQHVIPHYGIPKKVISNRDPRFTSNFTKELCRILGIKQNISTAYHPQTDGQSERTNQSLEQYLRIMCAKDQHTWAEWLPLAQYVRNSWPSSTTKKSPYELILGYIPQVHQPTRQSTVPSVMERLQTIKSNREAALEALQQAQAQMAKETRYKPFHKGEKVWLEGTHLRLPYDTMKLAPRQYGLFKITTKISDVAYKLELPKTWKIHDVFHASLLTPYKEMEKHGPNFLEPPPELIEGEPEWEVEQILGDRTYRRKKQFLIRWKGYAPAHDSWADESDINAPNLLMDYKKRTVSKVLSQLNQSAAQSSSNESAAQSSRPKHHQKLCIRTIKVEDEETFPHPLLPSACSNDPLVATLASTAPIGVMTRSTNSSTNSPTSHVFTSAPCVPNGSSVVPPSDSTSPNFTSSASHPLAASEARPPTSSMSDISSHFLSTDDKQSYYSPAVNDEHPLPGPGLTRPVTPDHISVASSTGDSDKENSDLYTDPYDDPYSPQGLAFMWAYARAAVSHWKSNEWKWLSELPYLSSEIFWTAHLPSAPVHSNDIDTHDTTNYARLHGALRAYREELAPYVVEHELVPIAEDQEDDGAEKEERGRIILEEIGIPGPYSMSTVLSQVMTEKLWGKTTRG